MYPSLLLFLDISGGELMVIALVIFIVLGPDKIPDIARTFGKAMRSVRSATEDIKREINIDTDIIQKPRSYNYTKKKVYDQTSTEAEEAAPPPPTTEKEPETDNKTGN